MRVTLSIGVAACAGPAGVNTEIAATKKPLPFRGGVGVGARNLAQGRWTPPPAPPPKGRGETVALFTWAVFRPARWCRAARGPSPANRRRIGRPAPPPAAPRHWRAILRERGPNP